MKTLLLLVVCAALLLCVNGHCTATASAEARPGANWRINGVNNQIYDIFVKNTGTQTILTLFAFFGFPSNNSVTQAWNYDSTTGQILNFGGSLAPGQTFNGAGFVLTGSGTPTLAFITPNCGGTQAPTQRPTQSPTQGPTQAPTQGPTQGPTQAPTQGPTQAPGNCSARVQTIKRTGPNSNFTENGQPAQIWDLVFTNTGTRSVNAITITITPAVNTSVNQNNKWNLVFNSSANNYAAQLFNALFLPNSQYTGSGFVVDGATSSSPTVAIQSVTC